MNNIIKNSVTLLGDFDTIQEILKRIRSNKSQVDFDKIKPMDKDGNDLEMNDYINLCLNVYIQASKDNKENLISTFKFVGNTRKYPYEFKVLSEKDLNSLKSKNQTTKLVEDAEYFINKIRDKSIFNGYMIRDIFWGTGSSAVNATVKENKFEFITYDKAPVKLFMELSSLYPNIKIEYCYNINGNYTKLYIKDGEVEVIQDRNKDYEEPNLYNLITDNLMI